MRRSALRCNLKLKVVPEGAEECEELKQKSSCGFKRCELGYVLDYQSISMQEFKEVVKALKMGKREGQINK